MSRRGLPSNLVSDVFFPAWKRLRRDPVQSLQRELRSHESWSAEAIREWREARLAALLAEAKAYVPFWRERLHDWSPEENGSSMEQLLVDLEPVDKELLTELGDQAWSSNPLRKSYASSTGGSTGSPFYFRCDEDSSPWRRANTARCLEWLGVRPGDRHAVLWGFALNPTRKQRVTSAVRNTLSNMLTLSSFEMDESTLDSHVQALRVFRPLLVTGYPSALAVLARHMVERGVSLASTRAAIASGETLFDQQRDDIEKAFACKVYNRYGSREFANVAHACEIGEGMHYFDDLCHVELLDAKGAPVADGELGELVITDLFNLAMPFLRYRTGDLAVKSAEPCRCGRSYPLLARVEGRAFDVVETPSGKLVGGYFWTWLSRAVPGIQSFQVLQEELSGVQLNIVPGDGWDPSGAGVLEEHIRGTCGEGFDVAVNIVTEIPLTPSGKHRFILNRLRSGR